MPEPIIFYDLPRKLGEGIHNKAWKLNTWKTRYTLNIKGLPYKTVWVEYPDIKPLCLKIGAPAAEKLPDGSPLYTLPVIYDPNTRTPVADSAAIARYLDETYPATPRLFPHGTAALHAAFQAAFLATFFAGGHFVAIGLPASHAVMNAPSAAYFRATREAALGKFLEFAPKGSEKRREHWEGLKGIFHTFATWLEADGKETLFFAGEGEKIVFADLVVAGALRCFRTIFGDGSEEWQDILTWDGGRWKRFAEALEKYEAVDEGSVVEL
ncbi:hypothetical protein BD310DRAFT_919227 [Dichomitus squalens]|uniref:GST N-terminal domain-containing protein n=1 Tax=Dichomitus squalens TaxID=114155 RepID=A0A4Q9Q6W5_9APHY|nr:hypothetical protein BD310DRAFT_919227 [Dichomitus squalens]